MSKFDTDNVEEPLLDNEEIVQERQGNNKPMNSKIVMNSNDSELSHQLIHMKDHANVHEIDTVPMKCLKK